MAEMVLLAGALLSAPLWLAVLYGLVTRSWGKKK
jgi:hypothetical protein